MRKRMCKFDSVAYEGGDAKSRLARAAAIKQTGANLIVRLAVPDTGHPAYEAKHAEGIASLGCLMFARTPDQFPEDCNDRDS